MAQYILVTDDARSIEMRDGVAYYTDDGSKVPEHLVAQYKSVLQRPKYNAKLLSQLTNTPYHFWYTASEETKKEAWDKLEKVVPDLLEIRDKELKARFSKRGKRAINARWRDNLPRRQKRY